MHGSRLAMTQNAIIQPPGPQTRLRRCRLAVALPWLCLALAHGAVAADPPAAVIPYKAIAAVLDSFDAVKDKDRLILAARILPARPSGTNKPVELQINSRAKQVPVKLAPTGELIDFPLTADLRSENPPVVSNQPKGSLTLQTSITLRYSGRLTESASWYVEALRQANAAIRAQAGAFAFVAPTLKTLVIVYPPGTTNSVTLVDHDAPRTLSPDPQGRVRIPFRDKSQLAQATLRFPEAPVRIEAE